MIKCTPFRHGRRIYPPRWYVITLEADGRFAAADQRSAQIETKRLLGDDGTVDEQSFNLDYDTCYMIPFFFLPSMKFSVSIHTSARLTANSFCQVASDRL